MAFKAMYGRAEEINTNGMQWNGMESGEMKLTHLSGKKKRPLIGLWSDVAKDDIGS